MKQYDDGVVKELAYCADKDYALEALIIPPDYADFDKAQLLYNRIGALSNLIFSKYFINYLGFDDESSMYFFEIPQATMKLCVKKLITQN